MPTSFYDFNSQYPVADLILLTYAIVVFTMVLQSCEVTQKNEIYLFLLTFIVIISSERKRKYWMRCYQRLDKNGNQIQQ
jgi:hypothetical protein